MTPSSVAVVVDASVAVKWVLPEEHTDRAHALMAASTQARQRIVGPPHLTVEVVNAIYQRRRRGVPTERLSEAEADQALARFLAFPLALLNPTPLYPQAFAFARTHGLSNVYDSAYVVLAQLLNTTLWTADETLLNALGIVAPWVRSISAYPLP
jgi:predicted nucleic acid-binding protein